MLKHNQITKKKLRKNSNVLHYFILEYDPLENKNLKELEEMDDDFDEEFLNMYK
jgi:hypothetical protein